MFTVMIFQRYLYWKLTVCLNVCATIAQRSLRLISQGKWLLRRNTSSFVGTREHGRKRKQSAVTVTWARSSLELREDGNKTTTVRTALKGLCASCLLRNWMNTEIRVKIICRLFSARTYARISGERNSRFVDAPLAFIGIIFHVRRISYSTIKALGRASSV